MNTIGRNPEPRGLAQGAHDACAGFLNSPLTVRKVIAYMTVLIPLLALLGLAITFPFIRNNRETFRTCIFREPTDAERPLYEEARNLLAQCKGRNIYKLEGWTMTRILGDTYKTVVQGRLIVCVGLWYPLWMLHPDEKDPPLWHDWLLDKLTKENEGFENPPYSFLPYLLPTNVRTREGRPFFLQAVVVKDNRDSAIPTDA